MERDSKMDGISLPLDERCLSSESAVLLRCQTAELPIILTAPHGGSKSFPMSRSMKARVPGQQVCTKSDMHTIRLLGNIDDAVFKMCGLRPHVVAARFHRKYIDANRNYEVLEQHAYHPDCELARSAYQDYHRCIEECVVHCRQLFPDKVILLLDIHGQKLYDDYIVLGTQSGGTLVRPAETHGEGASSAPGVAVIQQLRRHLGMAVLPEHGLADISRYSGGYTVVRHSCAGTVDAIQLEFGSLLRFEPAQSRRVGHTVALAVVSAIAESVTLCKAAPPEAVPRCLEHLSRIVWRVFLPGRLVSPWRAAGPLPSSTGLKVSLGGDGEDDVFETGSIPQLVRACRLQGFAASEVLRGLCVPLVSEVARGVHYASSLSGVILSYELEGELQMSREEYFHFLRSRIGSGRTSDEGWTCLWTVGHVAIRNSDVDDVHSFGLAWVLTEQSGIPNVMAPA